VTSGATFDPGFTTAEMTNVFSAATTVAAILEFEAALALALGDAGVAPVDETEAVSTACGEPLADPDGVVATTWDAGTPVIAVKHEIEARLADHPARQWVHFGATSQDALDTGRMLQVRRALSILERRAVAVARLLRDLVVEHREQPQMGQTFLQYARPTTFGARAAGWLAPSLAHIEQLRRCRSDLKVQLAGPSGTLAEFGPGASDVIEALAARLGLAVPLISWHSDRSPIWDLARTVEAACLTMAKIATDISLLAQSAVGELTVRAGGSSSMPGKRNPIDAVRAVAAASACTGFASMLTAAPTHELDRAVGGWHTEWLALPMLFHTAAAVGEAFETCLDSLEIDSEKMASRVDPADRPQLGEVDRRIIDGVLARFDTVVGDG
jgi:3-carboxy-cis,cis-muconate cycloisomerase